MKKKWVNKKLLNAVHKWLGFEGLSFFSELKEKYGKVNCVFTEDGPVPIPHSVHFREGMQVRNFLRGQPECKGWSDHDFDNKWADIIEQVIEMDDPFDKAMEII